jgi:TonB family protein
VASVRADAATDQGAPVVAAATDPGATVLDVGAGQGAGPADLSTNATGPGAAGSSARAAFLANLKARLQAEWRPQEIYKRVDSSGRLEGSTLVTLLKVRLRADGTLEHAEVGKSSGLPALDTEAIDAFKRSQPLGRPPAETLDKDGRFTVQVGFHLEVGVFRFASRLQKAVIARWHPSMAFRRAGDKNRATIARIMLTRKGVLVHAKIVSPAGIDFLDEGVLAALPIGMQLPEPPRAFSPKPGLVPVWIEFLHRVRAPSGLHIVKLTEEAEAQYE